MSEEPPSPELSEGGGPELTQSGDAAASDASPAAAARKGARVAAIAAAASIVLAALIAGSAAFAWRSYVAGLAPLDLIVARAASTEVVDREGRLLRAFAMKDGRWRLTTTTHDVDPRYLAMLIAYEDRRFAEHSGVDYEAGARAFWQLATHGRVVSGASTLTMQVARLLEPQQNRNLSAKLLQVARAEELERRLTKQGVLDLYLTLAPFGGNLEGARAASLSYFGKEPKKLTIAEAALLVALPQSPEARRPDRFAPRAERARARVLDRAVARGIITADEAEAAKRESIPVRRRDLPALAPHATLEAVAADPDAHVLKLSIDAPLQSQLEKLAKDSVRRLGPALSAAIVVIDNATGEVRARVGAADFNDASRSGNVDVSRALRSPGSALKPFIYAIAFEQGLAHPETMLYDRPARYGAYAPQNFDLGFQGNITARRALQNSLNLPAIEVLADVGPSSFLARLHGAGANIALPKDTPIGLAIGLGGLGISPTDLARLYAGFARGGEAPPLIERLDGFKPQIDARRVTDPVSAYYIADILRGLTPPANSLSGRIAFKTGTSYGFRDALAIGFDRLTTIAVWVGRPDDGPTPGLVGRDAAAPILFDAFERLGRPIEIVRMPKGVLHVAATADLPPPLRHLRQDAPKTFAAGAAAPLKIAFPPDGARVDLGLADGADNRLAMKAYGGALPLTWFVNGAPVEEGDLHRQAEWKPDGAGFVRVSVTDAKGAVDSVEVRVE